MNAVPSLIVFLFGAAIGSFLNVVIYRIPAGLSLLHPPSRCPHCQHHLRPYDNVPILGWFWLKGRCRYCHTPISLRYPLIEVLTGGLFLAAYWQFGSTGETIGACLLLSWLLALSFVDLDTLTLPNVMTQSGLVVGIIVQIVLSASGNAWAASAAVQGFMMAIVGAVLGIWLFDLIGLAGSVFMGQTAMGGGGGTVAALWGARGGGEKSVFGRLSWPP